MCVLARLGSFVSAQGLVPFGSLVSVLDNAQIFNSLSFRASATGPARLGTFMLILGDASVESLQKFAPRIVFLFCRLNGER